jgi:hypothetical protein
LARFALRQTAALILEERQVSKLAVTLTAAIVCAALSFRAEAMVPSAAGPMRAVADAINPLERAACGWYPIDYPQSWAVYTRGWGCRQVYSPYYYDAYVYRPYYGVYGPRVWYRRPYRLWWSWY